MNAHLTEKQYRDYFSHIAGVVPFKESSINRVIQHAKKGMIIISTQKSAIDNSDIQKEYEEYLEKRGIDASPTAEEVFLEKRNNLCDEELYLWLRGSENPYYYIPVYGGYHSMTDVTDSYERSFIVFCERSEKKHLNEGVEVSWDNLHELALSWCKRYCQDSVYIQAPGEAPHYENAEGEVVSTKSSKDTKYNRHDEMFFTTTKRSKRNAPRFTSDISFEESTDDINAENDYREEINDEDLVAWLNSMHLHTRHLAGDMGSRIKYSNWGELWNLK